MATFDPRDPWGEFGIGPAGPAATQPPPPVQTAQTQAEILEDWQLGRIDTAAAYSALVDFYRENGFSNAATRAQFTMNKDAEAREEPIPLPFPDVQPISDPVPDPLDTGGIGNGAVTAQGETVDPILAALGGPGAEEFQAELGRTREGRGQLFDRFLATRPGLGGLTNAFQAFLGRQFNPISARFALEQAQRPGEAWTGPDFGDPSGSNFRSFLSGQPTRFGGEDFSDAFAKIKSILSAGGVAAENLLGALGPEGVGRNIITEAGLAGINPFFRNVARKTIGRRISAFQDVSPEVNLFQEFANRGWKF
jgi:hypothetical protein